VSFSIPWLEFRYHLGDRLSGVDGREIAMPGETGEVTTYPQIAAMSFDFLGQRTHYVLRPGTS
jgi:hypothetical protein